MALNLGDRVFNGQNEASIVLGFIARSNRSAEIALRPQYLALSPVGGILIMSYSFGLYNDIDWA